MENSVCTDGKYKLHKKVIGRDGERGHAPSLTHSCVVTIGNITPYIGW